MIDAGADHAQLRQCGIAIDWRRHALTGIPVTLGTLAVAWGWLRWTG